jgi:hypothetical protein
MYFFFLLTEKQLQVRQLMLAGFGHEQEERKSFRYPTSLAG